MSLPYTVRLVVYDPNGARRAHLPDVLSCSPTSPFDDTGSLQFSYPKTGRNADLLTGFFEIGVEIDHGDGYVEPDGFRFVSMGWSDEGTEAAGEIAFDLPSYSWLLKRAAVLSGLDEEGRRLFENANAGQIMETLIGECQARGSLSGMSISFNGGAGSNGAPWTVVQTVEYTPGNDLFSILTALSERGLCDWTTKGRQLYMVPADTASVDRSDIVLRYGVDLTEGPNRRDATNLVHSIVVGGEGSARVVVNQGGGTPAPWGLFEDYLSVSGVDDAGYLTQAGQIALASGAKAGEQLTRTVQLADSLYAPLRDFDVGDWIRAPGMDGSIQKLRVREIAVTKDSNGVGAALLLSDRFLHAQVEQFRRQDEIEQAVYDNSYVTGDLPDWTSDAVGWDDWTPGDPSVFDRLDGLSTDYSAMDGRLSYLEQCCAEVGQRLDALEQGDLDVQVFQVPGPYTWVKPSIGTTVWIYAIGGGGGGGADWPNAGSAGGGGGALIGHVPMTSLSEIDNANPQPTGEVGRGGMTTEEQPHGWPSSFLQFVAYGGGAGRFTTGGEGGSAALQMPMSGAGAQVFPGTAGGGGGYDITQSGGAVNMPPNAYTAGFRWGWGGAGAATNMPDPDSVNPTQPSGGDHGGVVVVVRGSAYNDPYAGEPF